MRGVFVASCRRIADLFMAISSVGIVAVCAVVGWQVWGRYVLNDTPIWAERTALLLVLYFGLLGAAAGVRDGAHLGISFIVDALPVHPRRIATTFAHVVVGAFGAGMAWYGWDLAAAVVTHTIPTLGISESWTYVPIPLSGAAILLFSVEHLMLARDESPVERAGEGHV